MNKLLVSLLFMSCTVSTQFEEGEYDFQMIDYNINIIPENEMPYIWGTPVAVDDFPMDSGGVAIFVLNNKSYYHPVDLAQKILLFLSSYRLTQDTIYIEKSRLFINKLLEISFNYKDALYYPYLFNWDLHGIPGETMQAPWYSGMAQGQILSAAVRLFKFTADSVYFQIAHNTFNSFKYIQTGKEPWIVFEDKKNYYWIEEYPTPLGYTQALNGFIFAIFGLYEYFLLTKDPVCEKLLKAAITTIQTYLHFYRNPGDLSYYCLRHKIKYRNYHIYHTEQLLLLYKMTGEDFFQTMFINFYNDSH